MREFVGPRKKCGLILNALDAKEDARAKYYESQSEGLTALGFSVTELDLRSYFNREEALSRTLNDLEMLWVTGGNTFVLRRAMRQRGFDRVAPPLIESEKLFYGGFSAGVVVLHKDLNGLEMCDAPSTVPSEYNPEII